MVHCVITLVTMCILSIYTALDTGNGGTIAVDGNCANDGSDRGFLGGLPRLGRSARAEPVSMCSGTCYTCVQMLKSPTNVPTTALSALKLVYQFRCELDLYSYYKIVVSASII